jgi:tRNA modification GTPase
VVSRIDFPADVGEPVDGAGLGAACANVAREIDEILARLPGARRAQEGIRVTMVGRPNAGKSSLLNALVGYDRAIVTEHPGTTRDTLEDSIWLDGIELRLTDTAGVRAVDDPVERLGVDRAEGAVRACDLAVVVLDHSLPETESASHASELMALASGRPVIVAWNKADLKREPRGAVLEAIAEVETIAIRAGGAEPLRDALRSAVPFMLGAHAGEEIATTSARQDGLLTEARAALERAAAGFREDRSYDLIAVDLEDALRALAGLLGRGVDDQVLAAIFSRFCIGK